MGEDGRSPKAKSDVVFAAQYEFIKQNESSACDRPTTGQTACPKSALTWKLGRMQWGGPVIREWAARATQIQ